MHKIKKMGSLVIGKGILNTFRIRVLSLSKG